MQNLLVSRKKKNLGWLWGVIGIAFGGGVVWGISQPWFPVKLALSIPKLSPKAEKTEEKKSSDDYTAVYLDTNQVFYGKLGKESEQYVALSSAFYYQPGLNNAPSGNIRITKVGTELHKPSDIVHLNRSHVVMMEQLTPESKVTQAILKYKAE